MSWLYLNTRCFLFEIPIEMLVTVTVICCNYVLCICTLQQIPNSGKHPTVTAASRLRWNHLPTTSAGFRGSLLRGLSDTPEFWWPIIIYYHVHSCSILSDLLWAWNMIYMGFTTFSDQPTWLHLCHRYVLVAPQNDPVRRKVIYLPVKLIVIYRPLGRTRRPWFGPWWSARHATRVWSMSTPIYEFL